MAHVEECRGELGSRLHCRLSSLDQQEQQKGADLDWQESVSNQHMKCRALYLASNTLACGLASAAV